MTDLLVAWRGERSRTTPSQPHLDAYEAKVRATLDRLEDEAEAFPDQPTIGDVALGCALAYIDFRFADYRWRVGREHLTVWQAAFEARSSAKATAIVDDEANPMAPA